MIENALKAGQDKNLGHEYIKDIEERYRENSRRKYPYKLFFVENTHCRM